MTVRNHRCAAFGAGEVGQVPSVIRVGIEAQVVAVGAMVVGRQRVYRRRTQQMRQQRVVGAAQHQHAVLSERPPQRRRAVPHGQQRPAPRQPLLLQQPPVDGERPRAVMLLRQP